MSSDEARALLERTGVLFTQNDDDPGHISPFWRAKIEELCAALDATPQDAAKQLRAERAAHADTMRKFEELGVTVDRLLAQVGFEQERTTNAEEAKRVALMLVNEAVPRMRTLNNAMSPGWLARAEELLGG